MDANELLKKVRQDRDKDPGLSHNIFAGEYHSAFRVAELYSRKCVNMSPATISVILTGMSPPRHNKPYVKVYEEEREMTVMLLVDVSGSRDFGACGDTKKEKMAEVAATLAFSHRYRTMTRSA